MPCGIRSYCAPLSCYAKAEEPSSPITSRLCMTPLQISALVTSILFAVTLTSYFLGWDSGITIGSGAACGTGLITTLALKYWRKAPPVEEPKDSIGERLSSSRVSVGSAEPAAGGGGIPSTIDADADTPAAAAVSTTDAAPLANNSFLDVQQQQKPPLASNRSQQKKDDTDTPHLSDADEEAAAKGGYEHTSQALTTIKRAASTSAIDEDIAARANVSKWKQVKLDSLVTAAVNAVAVEDNSLFEKIIYAITKLVKQNIGQRKPEAVTQVNQLEDNNTAKEPLKKALDIA